MNIPGWTAVATSAALASGGRLRVWANGEELVLWRDGGGVPRLFANRCPHRGMRLSFGFVRGDRLVCPYHGWAYGTDGACRSIPAHPDLVPPATIRVEAWTVVERAGLLVAARPGRPAPVPDLPDGYVACRSIFADVAPDRLAAGLRDGLPHGWSLADGAPGRLAGTIAAGSAFEALVVVEPAPDGASVAHVSVRAEDPAVPGQLAVWLAGRRTAIEEAPP